MLNYQKVAEFVRSEQYSHALVLVQAGLSNAGSISPSELWIRSRILKRIGAEKAAEADLQFALDIDPLDPDCLELACATWPNRAEELATRLAQSPLSQSKDRQKFVHFLAPNNGPRLVLSILPTVIRAVLIVDSADRMSVEGEEEGDFQTPIQSEPLADRGFVATEYVFPRMENKERRILLSDGKKWQHEVIVPALDQQQPDEGKPVRLGAAQPWIIIPVHNGGDVVKRCLQSVVTALEHCPGAKVLIVDDLSHDPDTLSLLSQFGEHPCVHLHRTSTNLGFVGAVNTGLKLAVDGPVLLLNSDTFLPRHSLPRLMAHLRAENVATVTPFSNNAGSFSVPRPRRVFEMPDSAQSEALSEAAFMVNRGKGIDVLNGNGFAMLISATCRRSLPLLSEDFDGGYYEEVEYSLRAAQIGLRNICATDCFDAHAGTQSFGDRKRMLAAGNLQRLLRVFPSYSGDHEKFVQCDPLSSARSRLLKEVDWHPEEIEDDTFPVSTDIDLAQLSMDAPVLPVRGAVDLPVLSRWLPKLALIPEQSLSAHRLRVRPGHCDVLVCSDLPDQRLRLQLLDINETVVLETELSFASFEKGKASHFQGQCFDRICLSNE